MLVAIDRVEFHINNNRFKFLHTSKTDTFVLTKY